MRRAPERLAELQGKSIDAYERARRASPENPYVLIAEADLKARNGEWREAGDLYKEYLPIAAKYGLQNRTREGGGLFLIRVGKTRQAIEALERAKAANPMETNTAADLAEAYSHAGYLDQSLSEFDRGLALGGNEGVLRGAAMIAALSKGDRDEIRRRVAAAAALSPTSPDIGVEMARFLDDRGAAAAAVKRLADDETVKHPYKYNILAAWAAYYSAPELALELQRRFVATQIDPVRAAFSLWEPVFHAMRALPGFKSLATQMGLVDYWRAYGWNDLCHPVGERDFECD
jgi:tetratricopeptide (TPR) repeat protein